MKIQKLSWLLSAVGSFIILAFTYKYFIVADFTGMWIVGIGIGFGSYFVAYMYSWMRDVDEGMNKQGGWDMKCKYIILICFIFAFSISFIYQNFYMGDYIIQKQWISSGDEETNITYCDNCLWIEFSEGCNRYFTYYFENEHEINPRFDVGSVVNINWKKINGRNYIKGILNAKKYRRKS